MVCRGGARQRRSQPLRQSPYYNVDAAAQTAKVLTIGVKDRQPKADGDRKRALAQ
jgi:hypothetical protein